MILASLHYSKILISHLLTSQVGIEDALKVSFSPFLQPGSPLFLILVSIKKGRFLASENGGMGRGREECF